MKNYPSILATGTNATLWYYNTVQNFGRQKQYDAFVFPVNILQIPFHQLNAILPHKMDEAAKMLQDYLDDIKLMNASPFILANITLHEAYDKLPESVTSNLPFIHIKSILKDKLTENIRVAVIGSAYTMQHDYLKKISVDCGSEHTLLSAPFIKNMDELRKSYYSNSTDKQLSKKYFTHLIDAHPNIDVFIVACTELAIALEDFENKSKFLNLPQLQCEYLTDHYFNKTKL